MKKPVMAVMALIATAVLSAPGSAEKKPALSGEALFAEHCSPCHQDGGNVINPGKTLRKADREAHHIMSKADIVETMRHPGKGMTTWSAATLPDEEAEAIADYVIRTFK